MSWTAIDPGIPAPIVAGEAAQRVWVDMKRQTDHSVAECAYAAQGSTIEIHDNGPAGNLRFLGRSGLMLQDPSADELSALFGVAVGTEASCSYDRIISPPGSAPTCTSTHETISNHVVQTTPAQTLSYAEAAEITVPNGKFAVLWSTRTAQTLTTAPMICDCAGQLSAVEFFASRTASP